ncbi:MULTISPECIES: carbon-nitrogen hydrolase family protein [Photorhabdus]|uniref:Nitrilase n=2 Tax=Photorhabdus asymbiotica TaxID=291112 RepID=C7BJB4_PHOAA|nr:carbon-nitrogen hydrolase family protein [Photorhabdus asymbiotica]RKS65925.1 aliphatic nitrilase [Photorhabdus asymbiotica]CAQ84182.1 nitrilase [Photorhabdus asymbiotica]
MSTNTTYRVAAVQAAPVFLDLEATVAKTITLIESAANNGAKLIAFSETWIPGYPWFIWLDSPLWGMQFLKQYHNNSLVIDSKQYQRIEQAAADNNIMVVLGFSEKDKGSLYMSQSIIDQTGKTLLTRRKLKPTHVERTIFGEGDGSDLSIVKTPLGKVGALNCWEHIQPLSKYAMFAQDEQVHVGAWPSFSIYKGKVHGLTGEMNTAVSSVYALEGQCFFIGACALVSQEMIDMMCQTEEHKALLETGGGYACIYGPDGKQIAKPLPPNEEGLLYADIDLSAITLAKGVADPVGHYSRPDVTGLLLDKTRRQPVIMKQDYCCSSEIGTEKENIRGKSEKESDTINIHVK